MGSWGGKGEGRSEVGRGGTRYATPATLTRTQDSSGKLVAGVGMKRSKGGGAPVGYAKRLELGEIAIVAVFHFSRVVRFKLYV